MGLTVEIVDPDGAGVERCADLLRRGKVLGLPTDTVYGLAARAADERAVRRVYAIKGRSLSAPLVLMVAEPAQVATVAEVGEREREFMRRFWPGALTLVLRAGAHLRPPLVTGEPRTVGVRIPDHALALTLLRAVGEPLATTSANRSGLPPALWPLDVAWLSGVAAILDGGGAPGGVPSTLLDLSGEEPRILRPGPLTAQDLFDG
ncbi:MAG: L-threonylcarbamoyladenylate synthase [Candidatus Dormibacteraeota bacterium]|nr:L-threonylcarbamoyladenylate synthase [Candidatus Dormibacteraeota bacterium]